MSPTPDPQTQDSSKHVGSKMEEEEEIAAAREAAAIGGVAGDEDLDPAQRPVLESGGGESEGFEEAEAFLIEHASHGDQQSAHAVLHDSSRAEERASSDGGEADGQRAGELDPEERREGA
jgi:hypothetical protein